ncbi:unnamed protein product [Rotaria magnacalcarata]|uniref:Uncharacterized protein n=1 Tax=Rotaria magnacalcarata TaxID=392030 RepID=A0A816YKJ7_9BILA|nr:unnamed protein product [Rotaria magnacalcarata]
MSSHVKKNIYNAIRTGRSSPCNCYWGFNICPNHVISKHNVISKFETLSALFGAVYYGNTLLEKNIINSMNESVNRRITRNNTASFHNISLVNKNINVQTFGPGELREMKNVFDSQGRLRCTFCNGFHGFAICLKKQNKCFKCHQTDRFIKHCPELNNSMQKIESNSSVNFDKNSNSIGTSNVLSLNIALSKENTNEISVASSKIDTVLNIKLDSSKSEICSSMDASLNEVLPSKLALNSELVSQDILSNNIPLVLNSENSTSELNLLNKINSPDITSFNSEIPLLCNSNLNKVSIELDSDKSVGVNEVCKQDINIKDNKIVVDPITLTVPDYLRSDYFKTNCDNSINVLALSKNNYKLPQLINSCNNSSIEINSSSAETGVSFTKLPVGTFINFKSCVDNADQTDLNLTPSIDCTIQSESDNLSTLQTVINNDSFKVDTNNLALSKLPNANKIDNTVGTSITISDQMSYSNKNLNLSFENSIKHECMDDADDYKSMSDQNVNVESPMGIPSDNFLIDNVVNSKDQKPIINKSGKSEDECLKVGRRIDLEELGPWRIFFVEACMKDIILNILDNIKYECNDTNESQSMNAQFERSDNEESESNFDISKKSNIGSSVEEVVTIQTRMVFDTKNKLRILSMHGGKSSSEIRKNILLCLFSYIYNVDKNGVRNGDFTEEMMDDIKLRCRCLRKEVYERVGSRKLKKMNYEDQMFEYNSQFVVDERKSVMLHYSSYQVDEYEWTHQANEEFESIYVRIIEGKRCVFITLLQSCDQSVNVETPIGIPSDNFQIDKIVNSKDQQSIISNSGNSLSIKLDCEQNNNSLVINNLSGEESSSKISIYEVVGCHIYETSREKLKLIEVWGEQCKSKHDEEYQKIILKCLIIYKMNLNSEVKLRTDRTLSPVNFNVNKEIEKFKIECEKSNFSSDKEDNEERYWFQMFAALYNRNIRIYNRFPKGAIGYKEYHKKDPIDTVYLVLKDTKRVRSCSLLRLDDSTSLPVDSVPLLSPKKTQVMIPVNATKQAQIEPSSSIAIQSKSHTSNSIDNKTKSTISPQTETNPVISVKSKIIPVVETNSIPVVNEVHVLNSLNNELKSVNLDNCPNSIENALISSDPVIPVINSCTLPVHKDSCSPVKTFLPVVKDNHLNLIIDEIVSDFSGDEGEDIGVECKRVKAKLSLEQVWTVGGSEFEGDSKDNLFKCFYFYICNLDENGVLNKIINKPSNKQIKKHVRLINSELEDCYDDDYLYHLSIKFYIKQFVELQNRNVVSGGSWLS